MNIGHIELYLTDILLFSGTAEKEGTKARRHF